MMEYTPTYWNTFMPLVKPSLKKRYGKEYSNELVKKVDVVYRDLLKVMGLVNLNKPSAMKQLGKTMH